MSEPRTRDLSDVRVNFENAVYQATVGITEREEHKRRYTGNGHHWAQEISGVVATALVQNLATFLEQLVYVGMALDTDHIELFYGWFYSTINPVVFQTFSSRTGNQCYTGDPTELSKEISRACCDEIMERLVVITKDVGSFLSGLARLIVNQRRQAKQTR